MSRADQDYLEKLLLYYEEEIEGEAYFHELARMFDAPAHKSRLALLAEVERHAAAAVAPLIEKYGLSPRSTAELIRSGQAQARRGPAEWSGLMAEMNRTYPGYLAAFQRLEVMGPTEDRPRLAFLTEHEVAAMEFLSLEGQGEPGSEAPLRGYLAAAPEPVG